MVPATMEMPNNCSCFRYSKTFPDEAIKCFYLATEIRRWGENNTHLRKYDSSALSFSATNYDDDSRVCTIMSEGQEFYLFVLKRFMHSTELPNPFYYWPALRIFSVILPYVISVNNDATLLLCLYSILFSFIGQIALTAWLSAGENLVLAAVLRLEQQDS